MHGTPSLLVHTRSTCTMAGSLFPLSGCMYTKSPLLYAVCWSGAPPEGIESSVLDLGIKKLVIYRYIGKDKSA